jgi:hypothetical protein
MALDTKPFKNEWRSGIAERRQYIDSAPIVLKKPSKRPKPRLCNKLDFETILRLPDMGAPELR